MNNPLIRWIYSEFLYDLATLTGELIANIKIKHCLCASPQFIRSLLQNDESNIDALEWAQSKKTSASSKRLNFKIRPIGDILSAIFVPILCTLSVYVPGVGTAPSKTYHFDSDSIEGGSKFSLYLPLLKNVTPEIFIQISDKFIGEEIPLTFFYITINGSDRVYTFWEQLNRYLTEQFGDKFPRSLSFIIRGRFKSDEYTSYICNNQVKTSTLGNYEIVTLATTRKEDLCQVLKRRLEYFVVLP